MLGGAQIKKNLSIFAATVVTVVALDLLTKQAVLAYIDEWRSIEVVPGLFNLVHFKNPGAAFSILSEGGLAKRLLLILVSTVAVGVIAYMVRGAKGRLPAFSLSLVAGGAVGNLIDRVLYGEVVDFLYFHAGEYYWPAFNVADIAITTGIVLTLLSYYHEK